MGAAESAGSADSLVLAGMILGTGFNVAYYDPQLQMCINTECGGYAGFAPSDFELEVRQRTERPEEQHMEKMVSGAYQGRIILAMLQAAARDGLFADENTVHELERRTRLTAKEVDCFVRGMRDERNDAAYAGGFDDSTVATLYAAIAPADRDTAQELICAYYERAARLVAILVTGILLLGKGQKACLAINGSAYHRSALFPERFERQLRRIAGELYGLDVALAAVEENLPGATVAALMNGGER